MQTRINGTFVQRGYNGFVNVKTEQELADSLRHLFPEGSEVQIDMSVSLVRMRQLCEEFTTSYHSKCQTPLTDDGICPNADRHYVEEKVEA